MTDERLAEIRAGSRNTAMIEMLAEIDRLRAVRPVEGEDAARLDAIERGEITIECMGTTHPYQWVYGPAGSFVANASEANPRTLRECIDAARAPQSARPTPETDQT